MSVQLMTMDEINDVSGADSYSGALPDSTLAGVGNFSWGSLLGAAGFGFAFIKDLHFGYGDMRGNLHSNPFPIHRNPIDPYTISW